MSKVLKETIVNKCIMAVADGLGTNFCIVLFFLIAVIPLYYQSPHTVLEWQQYTSQTFVQLIALAILAKSGRVEGSRTHKLLREIHDLTMREIKKNQTP